MESRDDQGMQNGTKIDEYSQQQYQQQQNIPAADGYPQQPPQQWQQPPSQSMYAAPPQQFPGKTVAVTLPIPTLRVTTPIRGSLRMNLIWNYKKVTKCHLSEDESAVLWMYRLRCWTALMLEIVAPIAIFIRTGPKISEELLREYSEAKKFPEEAIEKMRNVKRLNYSLPARIGCAAAFWMCIRILNGFMDEQMFHGFLTFKPSVLHDYVLYLENESRRAGEQGLIYVPHPPIPVIV